MANPLQDYKDLPPFPEITADQVQPAVTATLEQNRRELESVLSLPEDAGFAEVVGPLEEMQDRLHRVWSPVSHLHGVANSPALREAYNQCLPELTRYETELAQNEQLFGRYQKVAEHLDPDAPASALSLLEHRLRDFRLSGVALPEDDKQRFREIAEQLSTLQAKFDQNVLDSMSGWSRHVVNQEELAGLPETILARARQTAEERGETGWILTLDQPTYVAVVTHAQNRDLRQEFYRAWSTRASELGQRGKELDNRPIIEEILSLRHQAATLVGFSNYAGYALATRMAGSVDEVRGFLEELGHRARPEAEKELAELEEFAGRNLQAWDLAWYSEQFKKARFDVSDEILRPYFPLEKVINGLFQVVNRLYGLRLEQVDGVGTWDPGVVYYRVLESDGTPVGGIYTDLFARAEKRPGAWMDECINRKHLNGQLQLPVAHLVCNCNPPAEGSPSLLSHDDVVGLFHEMGHVLHHLLTQVDLPGVAGINGVPWDAVELPSQFLENFAWEPRVINLISGHYRTGDPLPADLVEKLNRTRTFQAGMQMVRQLEFALFDFRLHAEFESDRGSEMERILHEVRQEIAVVDYPEFNRMPTSFSHIFGGGYAAGYYSYKWAEVLAADAFLAFSHGQLFDQKLAGRFREYILAVGGTTEISESYRAFRGRDAQLDSLLELSGITPAVS